MLEGSQRYMACEPQFLHIDMYTYIHMCNLYPPSPPPLLKSIRPAPQVSTLTKRLRTGALMGLIATVWIFSGNWVFSIGFAMQALLAQLEYYRMAMQKGESAIVVPRAGVCHVMSLT